MTKAHTPTEMSKGQSDNTNNATKSSIKQQLRTDFGRSVGVTIATQLAWLTWFTGPPSHSPQQPCYQKDTESYTRIHNSGRAFLNMQKYRKSTKTFRN